MRIFLSWSHEFAFQMSVIRRFSSVYSTPFHLFILFFFERLYLSYLGGQIWWHVFFCSFITFLGCLHWQRQKNYILLKVLFLSFFNRKEVSGKLFWKILYFNVGWRIVSVTRNEWKNLTKNYFWHICYNYGLLVCKKDKKTGCWTFCFVCKNCIWACDVVPCCY